MTPTFKLSTGQTTTIDALRQERASVGIQVLGIVTFALLTALGAQVRIYLWEVPFTLQTLFVYGSGLYLGWRNGMLSQTLYLALGMFLPVYAGDGHGLTYLLGAVSAGYLLSYPATAALIGALSRRWNTLAGSTVSLVAGSLILFTCGVVWLHFAAGHATWFQSIDEGWLRFIPVDAAKIMLAGLFYTGTRRFF